MEAMLDATSQRIAQMLLAAKADFCMGFRAFLSKIISNEEHLANIDFDI